MIRLLTLVCLTLFINITLSAQKERKHIRKGTEEYTASNFGNSEVSYQKALSENTESFEARFNLGDAFYKQGKYHEAIAEFSNLVQSTTEKKKLAMLFHNIGNCELKLLKHPIDTLNANEIYAQVQNPAPQFSQQLKMSIYNQNVKKQFEKVIAQTSKSINAFKNSLKNNSTDRNTKYNLSYAQKLKKTLEELIKLPPGEDGQNQQNQNQQNNQDNQQNQDQNQQNKDQNQDQNQENQNNQNQQNQDQQNSNKNDSDGDGIPDEIEKGENEQKPRDTDKDGTPDYKDSDSDNDGKPDSEEAGQNPEKPQDTDKDGLPDYRDLDSDNDGKPDSEEQRAMKPSNQISREDALRMLEAIENDEKEIQGKLKRAKGKKVSKEKDW